MRGRGARKTARIKKYKQSSGGHPKGRTRYMDEQKLRHCNRAMSEEIGANITTIAKGNGTYDGEDQADRGEKAHSRIKKPIF